MMKFWRDFGRWLVLQAILIAQCIASPISEKSFKEGADYFTYNEPLDIDEQTDGKILIQSFFDYDCRNCSDVQDLLELYAQINADHVVFYEYPVALKDNEFSARTFYALQAVGRSDVSDLLMFETANKSQYRKLSKWKNLLQWLEKKGVDGRTFEEMYYSPEIDLAVQQSLEMTEKYGVFTYPYVAIDGKYVLTSSTLFNDDYTFAVLDFLTQKIEADLPPTE